MTTQGRCNHLGLFRPGIPFRLVFQGERTPSLKVPRDRPVIRISPPGQESGEAELQLRLQEMEFAVLSLSDRVMVACYSHWLRFDLGQFLKGANPCMAN